MGLRPVLITQGLGQRYDVTIEAGQEVDRYWIRSDLDGACSLNGNA